MIFYSQVVVLFLLQPCAPTADGVAKAAEKTVTGALGAGDAGNLLRQDNQSTTGGGDKSVAQAGPKKTVDDLVKKARPGQETMGRTTQYEFTGKFQEALADFEALEPKNIRDISDATGIKKMGDLEDGRKVIVRNGSTSGASTLEIQILGKKDKIKFRYVD